MNATPHDIIKLMLIQTVRKGAPSDTDVKRVIYKYPVPITYQLHQGIVHLYRTSYNIYL